MEIVYNFGMDLSVYTDGSCFIESKIGGWGVYISINNNKTIEFSGSHACLDPLTMELFAIVKALEYIDTFIVDSSLTTTINIFTDCNYIVKLLKQKNRLNKINFPLRDKISKKNKLLLFEISNLHEQIGSINWLYIKSHSGIKGNEIADRLAKKAALQAIKKH